MGGSLDALLVGLALLPFLGLAARFLAAEARRIGELVFVIDDAWIHCELARNWARGHGFAFNPGHPIGASTAPLYTAALALLFRFSSNEITDAYAISIASTVLTIALAYATALRLSGRRDVGFLAATLVSAEPWVTWSALSGMEIALGSLLWMGALYSILWPARNGTLGALVPALALAGLASVRPEAYALLALYGVLRLGELARARLRSRPDPSPSAVALEALLAIAVLSPYASFCLATTGSPLPNTYAAKVGPLGIAELARTAPGAPALAAALERARAYAGAFRKALLLVSPLCGLLVLPAAAASILAARRGRDPRLLFPLAAVAAFVAAVGVAVPADRVPFPWPRHMLFLVPGLLSVCAALPFRVLGGSGRPAKLLLAAILAAALSAWPGTFRRCEAFFLERTEALHREHLTLARWVARHIAPRATIAASDIGAVGFLTENFVVDTEGIIDPEIRRFRERRDSPAKDREVMERLRLARPDYLFKFVWAYPTLPAEDFPSVRQAGTLALYRTPWTRPGLETDGPPGSGLSPGWTGEEPPGGRAHRHRPAGG